MCFIILYCTFFVKKIRVKSLSDLVSFVLKLSPSRKSSLLEFNYLEMEIDEKE